MRWTSKKKKLCPKLSLVNIPVKLEGKACNLTNKYKVTIDPILTVKLSEKNKAIKQETCTMLIVYLKKSKGVEGV